MSIFQQPRLIGKVFYSWTMLFLVCVVVFVTLNQIFAFYNKSKIIDSKLDNNIERINILENELNKKNTELTFLKTDRGTEDYLRKVFPLANEHEMVIILYNPTTSALEEIATSTDEWSEIKKKFKYFIEKYTNL